MCPNTFLLYCEIVYYYDHNQHYKRPCLCTSPFFLVYFSFRKKIVRNYFKTQWQSLSTDVFLFCLSYVTPNIFVDICFYFVFVCVPFGLFQLIKFNLQTIKQFQVQNVQHNNRGVFNRALLYFANRLAIFWRLTKRVIIILGVLFTNCDIQSPSMIVHTIGFNMFDIATVCSVLK